MPNAKLSHRDSRKFVVAQEAKARIDGDRVLRRVEERKVDKLVRAFTVRITQTQATRPMLSEDIARWCELYPERLPSDGGQIDIDLNQIQKL